MESARSSVNLGLHVSVSSFESRITTPYFFHHGTATEPLGILERLLILFVPYRAGIMLPFQTHLLLNRVKTVEIVFGKE